MAMLPAVQEFIDAMRTLHEEVADVEERWEKARPYLGKLLEDEALIEHSRTWPSRNDPARGHYENLLFYEDPDYGFVINALIKEAGESTPIHDHGEVWTLYGVLRGGETVRRYRRTDDDSDPGRATLERADTHDVTPGFIDFVPPGEVHAEYNGPRKTVGIIARSGNVGVNPQNWYDEEAGTRVRRYGPTQVPYALG